MSTKKYPYQNLSLKNIRGEQWKDIPGLEDYFLISTYGRVKRLEYVLPFKDGRVYTKENMMMKPTLVNSPNHFVGDQTHFLKITLNLAGNTYNFSIGRLVYYLFVRSFDLEDYNLLVISKDGNGKNIRPSNLLLATRSKRQKIIIERNRHENILLRPEVRKIAFEVYKGVVRTTVSQYNMKGKRLKAFSGIPEAAKAVGKSPSSISNVVRGRKISAGGYIWRYGDKAQIDLESYLKKRKAASKSLDGKKISQYDMRGNRVAVYRSINEAERKTGIGGTTIGRVILGKAKSAGGFYWQKGVGKKKIRLTGYSYGLGSGVKAIQKKVKQYDLKGRLLCSYPSIKEAAKTIGVGSASIVGALKGIYKTSGGYKWKYA
jgi:hypothetical protein